MSYLKELGRSQSQLTAHRKPLRALTGIRFFAAMYVVFYHTKLGPSLVSHGHPYAGQFFKSGYLAVALFFLLSGFILSYTYSGQIEKQGDYRRFWEARFARIWPVYVVSLLLTSAVHLAFPRPSYTAATLLMVQAWNPLDHGMWGAWNYVCWTLSVEAFFYVCFPWYQVHVEVLPTKWQLVLIGALLAGCVLCNTSVYAIGYPSHGVFYWIPLPLMRLPEFLVGVGLGNLFLQRESIRGLKPIHKATPTSGAWTYAAACIAALLLCESTGRFTSLIVIPFTMLIFGLAAERTHLSRFLSSKAIVFGGGISYSLYLVQAPVKDFVLGFKHRVPAMTGTIEFVLMFLLLFLSSTILFKGIEDPVRIKLRALFAAVERRRSVREV